MQVTHNLKDDGESAEGEPGQLQHINELVYDDDGDEVRDQPTQ